MEQIFPRIGLLLSSVAPLSAALHWVVSSAMLRHLVQCFAIKCIAAAPSESLHDVSLPHVTEAPRRATLTDKPHNNTARPHNPVHTRVRARPNSRARTLPTNRHEGGSLT